MPLGVGGDLNEEDEDADFHCHDPEGNDTLTSGLKYGVWLHPSLQFLQVEGEDAEGVLLTKLFAANNMQPIERQFPKLLRIRSKAGILLAKIIEDVREAGRLAKEDPDKYYPLCIATLRAYANFGTLLKCKTTMKKTEAGRNLNQYNRARQIKRRLDRWEKNEVGALLVELITTHLTAAMLAEGPGGGNAAQLGDQAMRSNIRRAMRFAEAKMYSRALQALVPGIIFPGGDQFTMKYKLLSPSPPKNDIAEEGRLTLDDARKAYKDYYGDTDDPAPTLEELKTDYKPEKLDFKDLDCRLARLSKEKSIGFSGISQEDCKALLDKEDCTTLPLREAVLGLSNDIMFGELPYWTGEYLGLTIAKGIVKGDPGVDWASTKMRPLGIGCCLINLCSSTVVTALRPNFVKALAPVQEGHASDGVGRAARGAGLSSELGPGAATILTDASNAFQQIHRTAMFAGVLKHTPELIFAALLLYGGNRQLFVPRRDRIDQPADSIQNRRGVTQGGPFSGVLYDVGTQTANEKQAARLKPLNCGCTAIHDDLTVDVPHGAPLQTVALTLGEYERDLAQIGIPFNRKKCAILCNVDHPAHNINGRTALSYDKNDPTKTLPVLHPPEQGVDLNKLPIDLFDVKRFLGTVAYVPAAAERASIYLLRRTKLKYMPYFEALQHKLMPQWLQISICRWCLPGCLVHLARTTDPKLLQPTLDWFDSEVRKVYELGLGVALTDAQDKLRRLPTRHGGTAVANVSDLAGIPFYAGLAGDVLSGLARTKPYLRPILRHIDGMPQSALDLSDGRHTRLKALHQLHHKHKALVGDNEKDFKFSRDPKQPAFNRKLQKALSAKKYKGLSSLATSMVTGASATAIRRSLACAKDSRILLNNIPTLVCGLRRSPRLVFGLGLHPSDIIIQERLRLTAPLPRAEEERYHNSVIGCRCVHRGGDAAGLLIQPSPHGDHALRCRKGSLNNDCHNWIRDRLMRLFWHKLKLDVTPELTLTAEHGYNVVGDSAGGGGGAAGGAGVGAAVVGDDGGVAHAAQKRRMDLVFELQGKDKQPYRVHVDVYVTSTHHVDGKTRAKWDGIFNVQDQKKHKKYDELCTKGKDLFYACGSDILGNLSPEFDNFLSYMFTYVVHDRGFEKNKHEQRKLSAMFHKLKTDIVFCHARFVGAAWRRHINTTLGAGHNVGQALDADDLRFLQETGHVDWHRLAA